ncbi:MAG: hypothetical protein JWN95_2759 [Frankiales bacterium]|nr:hypothetical protein [Frankiales bacterium]
MALEIADETLSGPGDRNVSASEPVACRTVSGSSTTGEHLPDRDRAGPVESTAAESSPDARQLGPPGQLTADERAAQAAQQMLTVNARLVIAIGTALFFVAFVVLLVFWSWLGRHDHRVWLWTALTGWVLGLLAMPLIGKHRAEGRLG